MHVGDAIGYYCLQEIEEFDCCHAGKLKHVCRNHIETIHFTPVSYFTLPYPYYPWSCQLFNTFSGCCVSCKQYKQFCDYLGIVERFHHKNNHLIVWFILFLAAAII